MTFPILSRLGWPALALALALSLPAAAPGAEPVTAGASVLVVSADGTILLPSAAGAHIAGAAAGRIVTAEGNWTFGAGADAGGDFPLLLNGAIAGRAAKLEVLNGNLYVFAKSNSHYSVRWAQAWLDTGAAAPIEGTQAAQLNLTVLLPKVPDNSPAGTVVARAAITMSPAGAQFTGPLVSSNPLYVARGTDIVLARALTAADDAAPFTARITALQ
jgi:hypothetical protein